MDSWTEPPAASATHAHGGRHGGAATITQGAVTSLRYLYREQPSPPEAYYAAWFFIPATMQVASWLSLHPFGYHPTAGSATTTPLFDFNIYPDAGGNLVARVYDPTKLRNLEQTNPVAVPLATWVHFEILFRKAADATGRIAVWQDGSNDFAPSPATVYFDDATISLARVGI
jgi:hypothetical protein